MKIEANTSQKAEELWQEFLKLVSDSYSEVAREFFARIEPLSFDAATGTITMAAESGFIEYWITNNYASFIREKLTQIAGSPVKLNMVVSPKAEKKENSGKAKKAPISPAEKEAEKPVQPALAAQAAVKPPVRPGDTLLAHSFNPLYTFDTFISGNSNALALAAAQAVATAPGERYNPLYIYGGSGLGKTHLLNAIGQKIAFNHHDWPIAYLSATDFVED